MLDPSRWRNTSQRVAALGPSRYGVIVDPALASFDFSWNGALATLNVAHQFFTWTRTVANHSVGGGSFNYPKDLPSITTYANMKHWPASNM